MQCCMTLKRPTMKLLKLTLVWSLSRGLVIRRTTGLESANLRTKNSQKDERKPAKILRAMKTESNRKYILQSGTYK